MQSTAHRLKQDRINWLAFIFVAVFALGQLARWAPSGLTGVNILVLDGLVFAANVYAFVRMKRDRCRIQAPAVYFLPFLWTMIISFLIHLPAKSMLSVITALGYLLRLVNYLLWGMLFPCAWRSASFRKSQDKVILAITAMAVLGMIQYFWSPDMRAYKLLGWDDHYYRLTGTLMDPNFTGTVMVFGIILLVTHSRRLFTRRISHQLALSVILAALVMTQSRSAWLTALATLALLFGKIRRRLGLLLVLAGLALYLIVPKPFGEGVNLLRTSTIRARITNYREAVSVIRRNPLTGVGYNFLRTEKYRQNMLNPEGFWSHSGAGFDSSLLFSWATGGIFAFGGLVGAWIATVLWACRHRSWMVQAATLAMIVSSFFCNTFYYPHTLLIYMTILGTAQSKDSI